MIYISYKLNHLISFVQNVKIENLINKNTVLYFVDEVLFFDVVIPYVV